MHIVYFMEGFANQLFQLCLYEKLKKLYGADEVYADISFYDTSNVHGGFKLKPLYKLQYINILPDNCINITEKNFFSTVFDNKTNYFYRGFWQDECFLPDDLSFIDKLFRVNNLNNENKAILYLIETIQSVSIHVRRGDFIDHYAQGNIANHAYFINAISLMKEKLIDPVFFVFSDDILWCRANLEFGDSKAYFITGNENHVELDMMMMSSCKHHIISNSSFSWMAQRLNRNASKIVVSPEYWFNDNCWPTVKLNKDTFYHVINLRKVTETYDKPFFSVLIQVFESECGLRRCMTSVLNQSFDNIEVLLITDISNKSLRKTEEYVYWDNRVKLIRKENPSYSSLFSAMDNAKGEYCLFLDSDDYLSENALDALYEETLSESVDALGFAYCIEPNKTIIYNAAEINYDLLANFLLGKTKFGIWNSCFSQRLIKTVMQNAKPFHCSMRMDIYLTVLLLFYARSYRSINSVFYHICSTDKLSTLNCDDETSLRFILDSIYNDGKKLSEFLSENEPGLVELVESIVNIRVNTISVQCRKMNLPIWRKMSLLKTIDDIFSTDYLHDYVLNGIKKRIIKVIDNLQQIFSLK